MKQKGSDSVKSIAAAAVLLFLLSAAGGAEPLYEPFPNIHTAAGNALKSGALKNGAVSIPAVIKGKKYPGTWAFWAISKGSTPGDFELSPMRFRKQGVSKGQFASAKGGCFTNLNFGYLCNRGGEYGIAFSFRNPSGKALELELDGSLRLYSYDPEKPFQLFVFTMDAEGKRKVISSSADREAIWENKYPGGSVYYFHLSADVRLEKGEQVFVALVDRYLSELSPGKVKPVFCLNEGRRKRIYVPCFILRSPLSK